MSGVSGSGILCNTICLIKQRILAYECIDRIKQNAFQFSYSFLLTHIVIGILSAEE